MTYSLHEFPPAPASTAWTARTLFDALLAELDKELPSAVDLRHRLHRNPCLSGDESVAAKMLASELDVDVQPVAQTGFVTRIGPSAGPGIAIRAELDALPIREATGVSWASNSPAMHACGHDVHQAALVALTRAASRVDLPVALVPIAQPREEINPSGAQDAVREGILEEFGVEAILAVHVHPGIPAGSITTGSGAINAADDEFEVVISGRGGHGAYPHAAIDPVPVAARTALALYDLLRLNISPVNTATLTIGELHVGSAPNVIAESAVLRGTLRTMDRSDRERMLAGIKTMTSHIAEASGAEGTATITQGVPVLENDAKLAAHADTWLRAAGLSIVEPLRSCGADDFSFFTEQVPGLMAFLGVDCIVGGHQPSLHSADFLPPDSAVGATARALAAMYVGAAESLGAVG
jgi:amidohydrolase